jgi:glutamate/tyrosine decarboxylase-like PLP-dependent enzyme
MNDRAHVPAAGLTVEQVLAAIDRYVVDDVDPVAGLAAGSPFASGVDTVESVAREAALRFWGASAMYRRYFPSIARMESELVEMAGGLLHAPAGMGGAVSSGGSESILLAVKAARDGTRAGGRPRADTLVLSPAAHPAFWKAAEYLGLRVRNVALDSALGLELDSFSSAVRDDVVLAVASAPSFALGSIDPAEEMSSVCVDRGVALHVDACVGGFSLPWLERIGVPLPLFDFRVEGVTSMSADLHKYGFAPRGISLVLCRSAEWSAHHHFRYGEPPRPHGWYVTPGVAGSRPASAVAAAWAVLMHLGEDGYLRLASETRRVCESIWSTLESAGLEILGEPVWSLFAFSMGDAGELTPHLAANLRQRGWLVHEDSWPQPLIRMMMAPGQFPYVDRYLSDLVDGCGEVAAGWRLDCGSGVGYT